MDFQKVKYNLQDGIATIALNNPRALNATDTQMVEELSEALRIASGEARAIILTGEGRAFCAGANLASGETGAAAAAPRGDLDLGAGIETHINPLVTFIRDLPIPFITAVNGPAAGIGCAFALLGDISLAAESAYFIQAFCRVGLVPDGSPTYLLPRHVGRARAMEMLLLGGKVSAKQACEWGMINRCVPDAELMSAARDLAGQLARGPKALGMIRKLVWQSLDADFAEQLAHERWMQKDAGQTEDFAEGVAAFREKRAAKFVGA
ncbi:MAG: enoyl-CoA hydratase-related protein [Hyphomonadaceae bacterium]